MTKPSWQDFGTHDESIVPELWDGVIGAWAPCLGPTGSRLHDMSRRSNWGTLTNMDNATDWVVSDGQYALRLNTLDANDHIIVTHPALPRWSITAWVRLAANATFQAQRVFSQSGYNLEISLNTNGLRVWDGSWRYVVSQAIATQVWYHIAVTFNGGELTGAINNLYGTLTAGRALLGTSWLGNDTNFTSTNDAWRGEIDSINMYNRVVSRSEIEKLYQLGRGGMYQRRRRAKIYIPQAGFQAAWASRRSQIIGGGLR